MEKLPKINEPNPNEENLYQLSQERKVFREVADDERLPENTQKQAIEGIKEIKEKLSSWSIKKEGGLLKAKERLAKDKEEAEDYHKSGLDERSIMESLGNDAPVYAEIAVLADKLDNLRDFEMNRALKAKTNPVAARANELLLATTRSEKKEIEEKLEQFKKKHPKECRAYELVRDAEGLHREGHIVPTASVQDNLRRIGRNMLLGKPMFLHGPTGTGKTSLTRYAARHFNGKPAEMVYCNPQTRESSVWGKTGIRPAKEGGIETIDIFGPLAKAMAEGKAVLFDEFSALPKEQMVFIKGIFNAKTGDMVNVVGNGLVKIMPGFQMIFTANLKSEKNPERQDLPPEIAREFEQNNIKINYQPKDESYDIMLARLMNRDGSVDASWMTLNETLPKLCEAMEEIQIAYTGTATSETAKLIGAMDASGKTRGLKSFVITQGTVEAILEDWKAGKSTGEKFSFMEHLDKRLKIGLTFETYPLQDRELAAKILASKGFLRTIAPQELGLPADIFNFDAAKKLRGGKQALAKIIAESSRETKVPLKELAELDPFNVRGASVKEKAKRMMGAMKTPESKEGTTSLLEAREIMGADLLGPEEIKQTFGIEVKDIPEVPFSREDLERAKELGQQLILQTTISLRKMNELLEGTTSDGKKFLYSGDGKTLKSDAWYKDEAFLDEEMSHGWRLSAKEVIPDSTSKNYLEQTDTIVNYITNEVFKGEEISPLYIEAIEEFTRERANIEKLMSENWQEAARILETLAITNLTRENPAEVLYRLALQEKSHGEKLLSSMYTWTSFRDSDGYFVLVGCFDAGGADVDGDRPWGSDGSLGVCFSRMK